MSVHDGHRQRMKKRFMKYGADSFDDINLLELILFYAIPRTDTNLLAHALLDRFGSFSAVMEASPSQLMEVEGVGENTAALLHLIPAVSQRYVQGKTPADQALSTPAEAARYLIPLYMYETDEVIRAVFLDARDRPIACRELSRGVVDAATISSRKLAEDALRNRASAVILSHNHPSGVALPSAEDEFTTQQMARALEILGIELRDHIVIAGCEYVSMREGGLLR